MGYALLCALRWEWAQLNTVGITSELTWKCHCRWMSEVAFSLIQPNSRGSGSELFILTFRCYQGWKPGPPVGKADTPSLSVLLTGVSCLHPSNVIQIWGEPIRSRHVHQSLVQTLAFLSCSPFCRVHHASSEPDSGQHHPLMVPARPAQWSHPGLWAAVLWKGTEGLKGGHSHSQKTECHYYLAHHCHDLPMTAMTNPIRPRDCTKNGYCPKDVKLTIDGAKHLRGIAYFPPPS